MSSLPGVPLDAAYHVISALVSFLTPLFGGFAAAAAIIAFTMAIRLLLLPLSYRAMRGLESQAKIAPRVQALQREHAGNTERLQRELAALYQAEGTTMFAGCLPLLIQWPFLSVLYLLFRSATIGGQPNQLLTHDLLGAPLSGHWLSGAGPFSAEGAVFLGLFALLAAIGWATARLARKDRAGARDQPGLAGVRARRRDQDHAVPDRGLRGVFAARGRDLPGHDHCLDARRADRPAPAHCPRRRPGAGRPDPGQTTPGD